MGTDRDDGRRTKEGLVVCLRDLGDGTSRLIVDDVEAQSDLAPAWWRPTVFVTWNSYDNSKLDSMGLSDDEFRRIGEVVVARLLAINKRGNKSSSANNA